MIVQQNRFKKFRLKEANTILMNYPYPLINMELISLIRPWYHPRIYHAPVYKVYCSNHNYNYCLVQNHSKVILLNSNNDLLSLRNHHTINMIFKTNLLMFTNIIWFIPSGIIHSLKAIQSFPSIQCSQCTS